MRETVVIVVTGAAPGFLRPTLVRRGQTLLALSSFSPELEEAARAAEARYVADDRRLTTALVFPGITRGARDACSTRITDAMKIAAAVTITRHCRGTDLLPSVLDPALHLHVAHAVQDRATREQTEPARVKGP